VILARIPASALLSILTNRYCHIASLSSPPGPPQWRALGCTPGTCCGSGDSVDPDAELLVAELMTNAVKATAARYEAAVRLRLSSDGTQVLIEVWDADPWSPPAALFLVSALSARWGWYLTKEPRGKVVWCEIEALAPPR